MLKYFYRPLLLIILLFLPIKLNSQSIKIIKTDIYYIEYDEDYEQPIYVEYTLLPNFLGNISRRGYDFWVPENVITSDDDDYRFNIWDKGHMVPAASFNLTPEMLESTFSYVNASLQHQSLNRGAWRELEEFERNLVFLFGEVSVTIEPVFSPSSVRLPTNAVVPDGFFKTIVVDNRKLKFYFGNQPTNGKHWSEMIIK